MKKNFFGLCLLLFCFSLFNYIYQKHTLNESNPANRTALCLAILENGSVVIDKYHQFSVDLCIRDGHYYCDKAPGVSFLSLPFVAVAYNVLQATGRTEQLDQFDKQNPEEPNNNFKLLIVVGSFIVSMIGAIAVVVMFCLMRSMNTTVSTALLTALLFGFGTPFFVWSTVMFGHSPAAAFLLFGLAIGLRSVSKSSMVLYFVTGLILAYSVWIEYTAVIPAVIIGLFLLAVMKQQGYGIGRIIYVALILFVGALPVAVGFFYYNTLAFGSPLSVGYQFDSTNFAKMDDGFCGLTLPNLKVVFLTLFDPQYGTLWFSPILFLSPFCVVANILKKRYVLLNVLCFVIPIYYFLMNSSYAYWMQSACSGRHLTGALPFLIIPIGLVLEHIDKKLKMFIFVFIVSSLIIGFLASNVPVSDALYVSRYKLLFIIKAVCCGEIRNMPYYLGVNPFIGLSFLVVIWCIAGILFRQYCISQSTKSSAEQ